MKTDFDSFEDDQDGNESAGEEEEVAAAEEEVGGGNEEEEVAVAAPQPTAVPRVNPAAERVKRTQADFAAVIDEACVLRLIPLEEYAKRQAKERKGMITRLHLLAGSSDLEPEQGEEIARCMNALVMRQEQVMLHLSHKIPYNVIAGNSYNEWTDQMDRATLEALLPAIQKQLASGYYIRTGSIVGQIAQIVAWELGRRNAEEERKENVKDQKEEADRVSAAEARRKEEEVREAFDARGEASSATEETPPDDIPPANPKPVGVSGGNQTGSDSDQVSPPKPKRSWRWDPRLKRVFTALCLGVAIIGGYFFVTNLYPIPEGIEEARSEEPPVAGVSEPAVRQVRSTPPVPAPATVQVPVAAPPAPATAASPAQAVTPPEPASTPEPVPTPRQTRATDWRCVWSPRTCSRYRPPSADPPEGSAHWDCRNPETGQDRQIYENGDGTYNVCECRWCTPPS